MNLSATELRQLRYRLGWSMAEMARCLKLDLATVHGWESGEAVPNGEQRNLIMNIMSQSEAAAEQVQRRPIAEVAMRERGLSQIHNLDLVETIEAKLGSRIGHA